jgi:hypothetical protein
VVVIVAAASTSFDAKSLIGQTFPGENTRQALQVAADRSKISSVVVYDA